MNQLSWLKLSKYRAKYAAGLTLVETLVGVGILTTIMGMFGAGFFHVLKAHHSWRDDTIATKDWRHAGSRFAGDALQAQIISLADGAPAVDQVILTWTGDNVQHAATYKVVGTDLIRELDGTQLVLAHGVTSASFHRTGRVLTFDLAVEAEGDEVEEMSLKTYLRGLP